MNRDSLFFGIIAGLIVPFLGMLMVFALRHLPQHQSFSDFIYLMKSNHQNIPRVISLSMIACIPLITYYKNRRRYQTLKGIFISIMFFVVLVVLYKFNML